jgi:hypothetical protein
MVSLRGFGIKPHRHRQKDQLRRLAEIDRRRLDRGMVASSGALD